ncbi:MAG: WhiB family transcriptional regulator [Angustibacter sp.]
MSEASLFSDSSARTWVWQLDGSCRWADPSVFFHPDGERGPSRVRRDAAAKAICGTCPVLIQCRDHALNAREPYGTWGGLTEDERRAALGQQAERLRNVS